MRGAAASPEGYILSELEVLWAGRSRSPKRNLRSGRDATGRQMTCRSARLAAWRFANAIRLVRLGEGTSRARVFDDPGVEMIATVPGTRGGPATELRRRAGTRTTAAISSNIGLVLSTPISGIARSSISPARGRR